MTGNGERENWANNQTDRSEDIDCKRNTSVDTTEPSDIRADRWNTQMREHGTSQKLAPSKRTCIVTLFHLLHTRPQKNSFWSQPGQNNQVSHSCFRSHFVSPYGCLVACLVGCVSVVPCRQPNAAQLSHNLDATICTSFVVLSFSFAPKILWQSLECKC